MTGLAIDLGGTNMRAAVVGADGLPGRAETREAPRSRQDFLVRVQYLIAHHRADRLGIGVPGLAQGSVMTWIPNLGFLDGLDLAAAFPGVSIALGNDAQLALRLIGQSSRAALEEAEDALREHGVDALLDDPRLLAALLEGPSRLGMRASWPLFCYVIVRQALRRAGEGDRALADYVAAIVLHFGARSRATRIDEHDDQEYDTLARCSMM